MSNSSAPVMGSHRAFLIAVFVSVVVPFIPFVRMLLIPFSYLNTYIHELCHALACALTGGQVSRIEVFGNGEGVTYTMGGSQPLIISAGYLGATLIGAMLIHLAKSERPSRILLGSIAAVMSVGLILWLRGDVLGGSLAALWTVVLGGVAIKASANALQFIVQLLAVQQCVNSFDSLGDLWLLNKVGRGSNDAASMGELTHTPPLFWAGVWIVVSVFWLVVVIRNQYLPIPDSTDTGQRKK